MIAESGIRVAMPPPAPAEPCPACDAGTCLRHHVPTRLLVPCAGRSHALRYCDAQEAGVFRWFETAFADLRPAGSGPIGLWCGEDAGRALSGFGGAWQLARPFTPADRDGEAAFAGRWLGWFADAAEGRLRRPEWMPEHDGILESYGRP